MLRHFCSGWGYQERIAEERKKKNPCRRSKKKGEKERLQQTFSTHSTSDFIRPLRSPSSEFPSFWDMFYFLSRWGFNCSSSCSRKLWWITLCEAFLTLPTLAICWWSWPGGDWCLPLLALAPPVTEERNKLLARHQRWYVTSSRARRWEDTWYRKENEEEILDTTMYTQSIFFITGTIYRSVDRPGLSSRLHGIPEGQRHRGPFFRQGNGLPRSSKLSRDLWRRIGYVRQEGTAKRSNESCSRALSLYTFCYALFLPAQVVVPKAKGEILGVVIVESGWGSMLPTIVLANLSPTGPAARCGQLNIGDQVKPKESGHASS